MPCLLKQECRRSLLTRLLLRCAVNTATACRNPVNIQLNNFTIGKLLLQNIAGIAVRTFIAELWGNDSAVADIEIDIASGKIIARVGLADG